MPSFTLVEQLIDGVYPATLETHHNTYNDRGIMAPTNVNIDHINDVILDNEAITC